MNLEKEVEEDITYEGALVVDPVPGIYNAIFCLDYHTLPQQHLNCLNCLNCLNVSTSHKMNNNCNKKDNILIYNNLDKITNST